MNALIVIGACAAYIIIAAAVWERTKLTALECLRRHGGRSYHACSTNHYYPMGLNRDCEYCARNVHASCDRCTWYIALAALWLPMIPIWVGIRIGKGKKVAGKRYRTAEKVAKDIARLEGELFGESK